LMGKAKNDRNLMVYAWFGLNHRCCTDIVEANQPFKMRNIRI
jgi:hypothetical protein